MNYPGTSVVENFGLVAHVDLRRVKGHGAAGNTGKAE